jgi:hypothetical protein
MIKFLRKLSGNRTHIANAATVIGTGLTAAGLNVDPVQVAAAATGSVEAVNSIVQAWDAGRGVNWSQVGIGGFLLTVAPFISSFFRELAAKPGRLAKSK